MSTFRERLDDALDAIEEAAEECGDMRSRLYRGDADEGAMDRVASPETAKEAVIRMILAPDGPLCPKCGKPGFADELKNGPDCEYCYADSLCSKVEAQHATS